MLYQAVSACGCLTLCLTLLCVLCSRECGGWGGLWSGAYTSIFMALYREVSKHTSTHNHMVTGGASTATPVLTSRMLLYYSRCCVSSLRPSSSGPDACYSSTRQVPNTYPTKTNNPPQSVIHAEAYLSVLYL